MSDIVFILGAGASRQCGGPLMNDFLDTASDLLRSGQVAEKSEHFERVFSAIGGLQAVHSKAQLDLNNLESVFTVLELGKILEKVPGIPNEEIPKVIASLKEMIVRTLEITIKYPNNYGIFHAPEPYASFASLIKFLTREASPKRTTSIITFNYDIAADVALHNESLGPQYNLDPNVFSASHVPLLKLHGSLNWALEKETKTIMPLNLNKYFQHYRLNSIGESQMARLPIGTQLVEYFSKFESKQVESEPLIVPPSWNKADYHLALSRVWNSAANHLSEAEYIYIMGYSLPETDSFFRHLYALGSVGNSPLRQVCVYNPDASGETNHRFRSLLGPGALARYEYHTQTFDKSLHHIKGQFR